MGGARLLVCLQDVASLGHTAHSFRHICVLHQLTAHTDVSVSVRHCAHSGDTRLSKAPFLPPRGESYINTPFFFFFMAFNILVSDEQGRDSAIYIHDS